MIDIGTNLANRAFRADLDEVLRRARAAGVTAIVATGTSEPASGKVWEIAVTPRGPEVPRIYCTAGIHPHHARDLHAGSIDALRALAGKPEVRAIGECGLDFDRDFSPRDAQMRCFEAQLALAAELQLPVFLHERAAHQAFHDILARWRPRLVRAVVHCFTGEGAALRRYLDLDLHIGITGWICDPRRGTHLLALSRSIPDDRLMIETDAPYILPRNMPRQAAARAHGAGHRNEPAYLRWVLAKLAEARGVRPEDLERTTDATAKAFFGLTP